ncbi:MAG: type VI secretion system protein ImpK [Geobacteraceae bacterium GWC2_58_44]|nr:MAG: type VI secretion system protein ImpK [Geobacteraceae bacterium GWC2_58_44]HBG06210.1 DotU family type IV/VI secretion system protein [Geobacter sp.]
MHLSDCFIDVMAYVSYFLKSVQTKQPAYEEVKDDIRRLLSESEGCLARGLFPPEEYDQARFALCAWIDEAILGSRWLQKNRWLNDQLQRLHYNTTDAGEEFFERLNNVGLHQRDVREVYYLCLSLGFTGRYCHPGDEYHLEQIKSSNLKLLLGSPVGLPQIEGADLFPEAHPSGDPELAGQKSRAGSRLVAAVCLAAPVLLFCILYLIYHFTLSGISDNFLRTVTN